MKNFLILMLILSATITFAQSKIQTEPVKQSIESEDIKKEMKTASVSNSIETDGELDKLSDSIEEELELLEEETDDMEMKEEEIIEKVGGKEKLKIKSEKEDPKSKDE